MMMIFSNRDFHNAILSHECALYFVYRICIALKKKRICMGASVLPTTLCDCIYASNWRLERKRVYIVHLKSLEYSGTQKNCSCPVSNSNFFKLSLVILKLMHAPCFVLIYLRDPIRWTCCYFNTNYLMTKLCVSPLDELFDLLFFFSTTVLIG